MIQGVDCEDQWDYIGAAIVAYLHVLSQDRQWPCVPVVSELPVWAQHLAKIGDLINAICYQASSPQAGSYGSSSNTWPYG